MARRPEPPALNPSIKERISAFNTLADSSTAPAPGRRAVSGGHVIGTGRDGSTRPSPSSSGDGLGIVSGDVVGTSDTFDAFADRLLDGGTSKGVRARAGSASVVDTARSKAPPPPPVPRRPLNGKAASLSVAAAATARPRAGSHHSPLTGTSAGAALDKLSPPLVPDTFGSPTIPSSAGSSPRIPVSSIISLYNKGPSTVSTSSTSDGSRSASPAMDMASQPAVPLSSSPTSERSLERIPAMTPSPISSRPSSPFKSLSTSPLTPTYRNDEGAVYSGPPPTPPRPLTPSSASPRRPGVPKPTVATTTHPLASSTDDESADMISFTSPSEKTAEWSGRFQLQPPTPMNASRASTVVAAPSPPPRPGSSNSMSSTAPLPASLNAPRLPPRRASATSVNSTTPSASPALPPSLPPRRTTAASHSRNPTASSFHSVSLSSDGGEGGLKDDEDPDDLVKVEWTGSSAPQGKPVPPPPQRSPSPQTTPTLGSLSSFNRAPLPPPKRKPTTPAPPSRTSRSSTPVLARPAAAERDREGEKARAVERYESLWEKQCALEEKEGRGPGAGEERRVIGVVVREIWSRSKLPPPVLAKIWMSCDPYRRGSLDRDGFVKGMSLIENELRRRRRKRASASAKR